MLVIHKYTRSFPLTMFFQNRSFAFFPPKTIKKQAKIGKKSTKQLPVKPSIVMEGITSQNIDLNVIVNTEQEKIKGETYPGKKDIYKNGSFKNQEINVESKIVIMRVNDNLSHKNKETKNSISVQTDHVLDQVSVRGNDPQNNQSIQSAFFGKKVGKSKTKIEKKSKKQLSVKKQISKKRLKSLEDTQNQKPTPFLKSTKKKINEKYNNELKDIKSAIIFKDQISIDKVLQQKIEPLQKLSQLSAIMIELATEATNCFITSIQLSQRLMNLQIILNKYMNIIMEGKLVEDIEGLLNYIDFLKTLAFLKMQQSQINLINEEIDKFMQRRKNKKIMKRLIIALLQEKNTSNSIKIRSVCLMRYMSSDERDQYLQKIVPLVKYFKKANILILIYEQYKYKYIYSYQLLNQIYNNEDFININDINSSYLKMLFIDKMKGHFLPSQQVLYKMLDEIQWQKDQPESVDFEKLFKIIRSQYFFISSHITLNLLRKDFKFFLQKYSEQVNRKSQLDSLKIIQMYVNFKQFENCPNDDFFLSKIIELFNKSKLEITANNFQLYKKMLIRLLKDLTKNLKYEHKNEPNQKFTRQILQFVKNIIPKYIQRWPEVIFEVNHISFEMFSGVFSLNAEKTLLQLFQSTFKQILKDKKEDIKLQNSDFSLKILKFLVNFRIINIPLLSESIYISLLLLEQINNKISSESLINKQLEIYYLCLTLLADNDIKFNPDFSLIREINTKMIEKQIAEEMNEQMEQSLIHSLDQKIIWLALCSAQANSLGFIINESLLIEFINKKLYFMINSLQDLEVYQMLVFTLSFKGVKCQIYERLLLNLSTFIISVKYQLQKTKKINSYHLNPKYASYYSKICKLIINNESKLQPISNKNCFIIVQIMLVNQIKSFLNEDILCFLNILSDSSFLSSSMEKKLAYIVFTNDQLGLYQSSQNLRSFKYYNKSLLTFFGGITYKNQMNKLLSSSSLTKQEINQYLSQVEVYKTIFMDGDLSFQFDLPEPVTKHSTFKLMFICQQIYKRIKHFNFDFDQDWNFNRQGFGIEDFKGLSQEAYFLNEITYINREKLIPRIDQSQFRIYQKRLPQYIKMKIWTIYTFCKDKFSIDEKDLTFNNYKFQDQILQKVCQSFFGSENKVKEVISEFTCDNNIVNVIKKLNIRSQVHGAAIKIKDVKSGKTILTILCSNNKNYKLLYICAFILARKKSKVVIVKQNQNIDKLTEFLEKNLLNKAGEIQEQQQKQNQETIEQLVENDQS